MIVRNLVCIPVYNNPDTVSDVVIRVLNSCNLPVLIVDDGSSVPVERLLPQECQTDRVMIHRFEKNQGKGSALKFGFHFALSKGYTHLISVDADGQHFPEDIPKFLSAIKFNPWSLIIGAREFKENVPGISKFGRKFSNFWVKYQTELVISDSQSGFRCYPLFHVQTLNLQKSKYDLEIEILVKLLWSGVAIQEVPIQVYYAPGEERVSHFDKVKDNARISLLNAKLVIASMIRAKRSDERMSVALGLGVFIGCTPLFGLHTFLALLASFVFRLNALALWVGTQISLPPFILPLVGASLYASSIVTGNVVEVPRSLDDLTLNNISEGIFEYAIGSAIVGTALGLLVAGVTYAVLRWKSRDRKTNWNGKIRGGRFGNWLIGTSVRLLGIRFGYFLLNFVIPYFYLFAPKARRSSRQFHLRLNPKLRGFKRIVTVYRHLFFFGQTLLDRVYQSHFSERKFELESSGFEAIRESLQKEKSVVIVGAHFGAWDMAQRYLFVHGLETKFQTVQYRAKEGVQFDAIKAKTEVESNKRLLETGRAEMTMDIHGALASGQPIALMADRPNPRNTELVPFEGGLLPIDVSPFRIALAANVPIIFTAGFKKNLDTYSFCARRAKASSEPDQNKSETLYRLGCEYSEFLEDVVKMSPNSWFNFFPVFSAVPDYGPLGAGGRPIKIEFPEEWPSSATQKSGRESGHPRTLV
ncbi:MAG: DUF2062 domain-containing protein [Bdellovibrionales bacterium]|nr:DUF2062 domain-containing protein [Bdellovibrionales bacterium]